MYDIYGDWLLVIAAYNCGPGNVNKAIRRSGGKTNFWEIAKFLPAETRGYVQAFIAVTYVMNYASEHQIFPVQPAYNYFEVDTLAVDKSVSLKKVAAAVNLPLDVIKYLNPVYKRGIIPQTDNSNVLRLPASSIPDFLAAEATLYDQTVTAPSLASSSSGFNGLKSSQAEVVNGPYKIENKRVKKIYTIRSGDNLSTLASRFSCSVTDLKSWNKLNSNVISAGRQLSYYTTVQVKVPVPVVETNVSEQIAGNEVPTTGTGDETLKLTSVSQSKKQVSPANPDFVYHVVEKGDTLWNIAKRYEGATVEQIMEINKITNSGSLVPGTKIKVKING
jgi:membrane-bound lytic murein transglycosylase D